MNGDNRMGIRYGNSSVFMK